MDGAWLLRASGKISRSLGPSPELASLDSIRRRAVPCFASIGTCKPAFESSRLYTNIGPYFPDSQVGGRADHFACFLDLLDRQKLRRMI